MSRRPVPRLHLIGPLVVDAAEYPRIAAGAVQGGCDAVHVRVPGGATESVLELARAIRSVIGDAALIINDRLDIALVAGADGVQLGERGFSVEDARRVLPAGRLIGRSVHDLEGARAAATAGADYLLAGHVFETPSKRGTPGRGLDWLAELVAAVPAPVIALGGITTERIPAVLETGAHGVALGRELLLWDDPEVTARQAADQLRA
ncbi:MAG: thiamine phosphate synthase [Thermomicrobiales bacterium]